MAALGRQWASLMAQLVKNLPAMRKTCVRSLGWEDPLEKGKATHSSILAWRIPRTAQSRGPVHRFSLVAESRGYSLIAMLSLLILVASLGVEHRL